MFVAITVVLAALCAIVIIRYYAVKTRLTEKSIDKAIARRLLASPVMLEVRELRELNSVMRNLLIDFVEAEEIKPRSAGNQLSSQERKQLFSIREARRREAYAEALVLLRQTNFPRDKASVE